MEISAERLRLAGIVLAVLGLAWLLLGNVIFVALGFVGFLIAILSAFYLLDKLPQRMQGLLMLAALIVMGVNLALHGKGSISYRIVAGTLTGLFGGRPECSGPMEWRCDSD